MELIVITALTMHMLQGPLNVDIQPLSAKEARILANQSLVRSNIEYYGDCISDDLGITVKEVVPERLDKANHRYNLLVAEPIEFNDGSCRVNYTYVELKRR